ncbi:MAG: helix-turn-helix domain-containing protein [Syntrophobacteraceae bacterium]
MRLAAARAERAFTQWDLALETRISQARVSLIERGYIVPCPDEKERLANALGLKVDQIEWPQLRRGARLQSCEA